MNLDNLKAQRRWVGFRSADDKAPMNPHTGRNASSTKPDTWATFDEAMTAQARYGWAGVGVVLNGDAKGMTRNALVVQVLAKATKAKKRKGE